MTKHRQILYGHPVPQSMFDALQEFISTTVSGLELTLASGSSNTIQVVAGQDNDQVGVGINGLWRYNDHTVSAAVTGPAGTYDLYVTCANNDFEVNASPPPPEIDRTDYSFSLASVAAGATPTGVDRFRKVGEAVFDGSRVLLIRQLIGGAVDGSQLHQPGDIKMSAAAAVPTGWLVCDGSAVSRSTYSALYAALGGPNSQWGQGDGTTTFNLPDFRGRAPIGVGTAAANTDGSSPSATSHVLAQRSGAEAIALAVANMPSHNHGGVTGTGTSGAWSGASGAWSGTSGAWTGATAGWTGATSLPSQQVAGWGMGYQTGGAVWNNAAKGAGFSVYVGANFNHTHTIPNHAHTVPSHTHTVPSHTHSVPSHTHTVPALSIPAQGSGSAHSSMQPSTTCNFLIKT